jgi:hypothetical protein
MSSTIRAPFKQFGKDGDYPVELNYGLRIYTNPPQNERVPKVGEICASLKGGQRTNFHGEVPLLDGDKKEIGKAEILKIVSARPEFIPIEDIRACGFESLEKAIDYIEKEHREEFERDGVMTFFYYRVVKLMTSSATLAI